MAFHIGTVINFSFLEIHEVKNAFSNWCFLKREMQQLVFYLPKFTELLEFSALLATLEIQN